MNKSAEVAVIMGSDSDLPVMREAVEVLKKFGISYEVKILSAHRSPEETARFAKSARKNGIKVVIAGAGGAAHLAGVVAGFTTLPVIGVPMESASLKGLDSLLSTVQMPAGIPVATVAIGAPGAKNAGILAAQILAVSDEALAEKLKKYKTELAESVSKKNTDLKL
ncbi:MAG: 5-(carboxyamino)imidazole ribonucleotide mutase [Candidatus Omnitrophica bacterium]|nr:5-(carboxyamino)imidazole ribonucleotide mutase [Candidatus Omnitrophota bacterium]